jgi:hypothetical protein
MHEFLVLLLILLWTYKFYFTTKISKNSSFSGLLKIVDSLIHTCHAAPLPCSDNAVCFVKVRVVAGNIRTASPSV